MMDVMRKAFEEALANKKNKAMKIEITFGNESKEKEEQAARDLAPEVKDKPETEVEVEQEGGVDEQAMMQGLVDGQGMPNGRDPKTLNERAAIGMKKKLEGMKK